MKSSFLSIRKQSCSVNRRAPIGAEKAPPAAGRDGWRPAALLLACPAAWAQNGVFSPAQPVGTASRAPVKVTVTASATALWPVWEVLTAGVANLDFTAGSGTSTCMATPFLWPRA